MKNPQSLTDAVAAFTFSRLPREERIAKTLLGILASTNAAKKPEPTATDADIHNIALNGVFDLVSLGREIAQYSVKDFAVRYGHLNDGMNPDAKT